MFIFILLIFFVRFACTLMLLAQFGTSKNQPAFKTTNVKSCFKLTENNWLSASCETSYKPFEALIKTTDMPLSTLQSSQWVYQHVFKVIFRIFIELKFDRKSIVGTRKLSSDEINERKYHVFEIKCGMIVIYLTDGWSQPDAFFKCFQLRQRKWIFIWSRNPNRLKFSKLTWIKKRSNWFEIRRNSELKDLVQTVSKLAFKYQTFDEIFTHANFTESS